MSEQQIYPRSDRGSLISRRAVIGRVLGAKYARDPGHRSPPRLVRSSWWREVRKAAGFVPEHNLSLRPLATARTARRHPILRVRLSRPSHTLYMPDLSHIISNAAGKLPQSNPTAEDDEGTAERVLIMLLIFGVSLFGRSSCRYTRATRR